jgi:hypothetical protein
VFCLERSFVAPLSKIAYEFVAIRNKRRFCFEKGTL